MRRGRRHWRRWSQRSRTEVRASLVLSARGLLNLNHSLDGELEDVSILLMTMPDVIHLQHA